MTDIESTEQDEMVTLKGRADLLGIQYHPSIGADKLREKVRAAMADEDAKSLDVVVTETPNAKRLRLRNEASALVRIRITCMNPAKKEWDGEIITVGNAAVGSFKKYIPFNADEGWHVPQIILQVLRDRTCQIFYTEKTKQGVGIRKGKLIKEFAIEVLPQLTQKELDELARRQAMAKSID